jgi:hypothetical protein
MRSLTAAISVSSLLASLHVWALRFLTLATEEGKQAGQRLLSMLGLALLAAGLAITGWLGLLSLSGISCEAGANPRASLTPDARGPGRKSSAQSKC